MHWTDWSIVAIFFAFLLAVAVGTQRYVKSVADFLAASRCAGRYLLTTADAMVGLGAISIVSFFEMYYEAGFTGQWWAFMHSPIILLTTLSGWVIYRFRQTRCLTLVQFFELRYSKRFRIFFGIVSFVSSMIGIGIMPAVAARFFIHFCAFPAEFTALGLTWPTFPVTMFVMLAVALFFTFSGGHITVMITDFLQGMFSNVVFLVILVVFMLKFKWSTLMEGLAYAPAEASLVHPFHTSETENFNVWFFLILMFNYIFVYPTWLGNQAYKSAARNAHEARMALVLSNIRGIVIYTVVLLLPVCAYMVMHHPQFAATAADVQAQLDGIDNETIRKQMLTPLVLGRVLPQGILGAFCAVMLAAFISTSDTILHAYGSILMQDIILPFRKKPFDPKRHLVYLRLSVIAVAVFIFFFSWVFRQTQHIMMHWAIVGAIYYGGAGAALIGGLYWKHGTTAAAWTSAVAGLLLGSAGFAYYHYEDRFAWRIGSLMTGHDMNGQEMSFWIALVVFALYIVVSLLQGRARGWPGFDMDRLLHRGGHAVESDRAREYAVPNRFLRLVGINNQFSGRDRVVYLAVLGWSTFWFLFFVVVTAVNRFVGDLPNSWWAGFWHFSVWNTFAVGSAVTVWLLIGGVGDLRSLLRQLRTVKRNALDDGMVIDHHNLEEEAPAGPATPTAAGSPRPGEDH